MSVVRDLAKVPYVGTERPGVRGPREAWQLVRPHMETLEVESFCIIVLDAQHRAIAIHEVTRGTLNSTLVHPREVFRLAIALGAASIVLAHNHPSGDTTPSADDRAITSQLVAGGRLLDIPVQDHIVVGDGRFVSFAEAGLM